MMAICVPIASVIMTPADFKLLGQSVFATTIFSSNMLFWYQAGYFDVPASSRPFLHTWSLAVEEQFYAVFPIFLIIISKYCSNKRAVLTFIIFVFSFILSISTVKDHPSAAFYLAPHRVWEVLIGALIAMSRSGFGQLGRLSNNLLCFIGLGAIAAAIFCYSPSMTFPGVAALPPVLGTAAIIWAGRGVQPGLSRALGWAPFVFVGKISYSLYLWHFPLLALAGYVAIEGLDAAEKFLVIALAFGCAILSWIYVEQPIRRRRFGGLEKQKVISVAMAVMVVFGGAGLGIHLTNGFSNWLDPGSKRILASETDIDTALAACEASDERKILRGELCGMGVREHPPKFILWGDSHAEALRSGIDDSAVRKGWSGVFAGRGGCAPVLHVERVDEPSCGPINQAIATYIVSTPSIEIVVLSARWGLWAEGTRYKHEDRKPAVIVIRPSEGEATAEASNHQAFASGLMQTIEALRQAGKEVWLIGPVPEVGYIVPRFAYLKTRPGLEHIDIRPTRDEFESREEFVFSLFNEAREKHDVKLLWLHEALCDMTHCRVEENGVPIYQDDNHLTRTEALTLSPRFDSIFR